MYQSHASSQVATALNAVKGDAPTVTIQHFTGAGAGLARFVAKVVHTAASRANPALIGQAIREKFNGQLQAVAGSITVKDQGPVSDTVTGIISVVRESVAVASDADLKGFRAIASNMYLDDEERMWTLNTTATGDVMVRTTGIDDDRALLNLMSAHASAAATTSEAHRMIAVASAARQNLEAGQFVSYVNHNNEVGYGYLVVTAADAEDAVVLPHDGTEPEQINVASVVEAHEVTEDVLPDLTSDEQVQISIASSRGAVNLEMMVDYYRRVFGHNKPFFDQFVQRLRGHQFA